MMKQMSRFAMPRGIKESGATQDAGELTPDVGESKMMRVMSELERDMEHLDENNPKHMAHLMRKMKDALPSGAVPRDIDTAIKRLEAGEDPEKIEADMGDVFGDLLGGPESGGDAAGGYTRDNGLYDY
jgi:hypothetical protein